MDYTFTPPPAAFPPTPRAVRMRSWPFVPIAVVLVLALLAFGLCPVTILPLSMSTAARWVGTSAPGRITDKQARGNRRYDYIALFEFLIDGKTYHAEVHVSRAEYANLKAGDVVRVQAFSFWPSMSASIVEPDIETPTNVYAASIIVLILNGALVLVICIFLGRAYIRKKLARFGTPTLGRVVGKQMKHMGKGRAVSYRLTYKYHVSAPTGETEREGMMEVTLKNYNSISTQQDVTVLYDPSRPEESMIYCFGGYQIVGI